MLQCISIVDFSVVVCLHLYGLYNKLFSYDGTHPHNGGYYAIDSLRIEKAYRHWGGELDTDTTPWEAGLGFSVDSRKVVTATPLFANHI